MNDGPKVISIFNKSNLLAKNFCISQVIYFARFKSLIKDWKFRIEILVLRNIATNFQILFSDLSFRDCIYKFSADILKDIAIWKFGLFMILFWTLNFNWTQIFLTLTFFFFGIVDARFEIKVLPLQGTFDAELKLRIDCFVSLKVSDEFLFSMFF